MTLAQGLAFAIIIGAAAPHRLELLELVEMPANALMLWGKR
jgi:hypothetical protein